MQGRGRRRARRSSVIVTARRPLQVHARTVQDNASRLVNITKSCALATRNSKTCDSDRN